MGSNTASVGALLKEQVEPGIINQMPLETPLLDSFSDVTDTAILGTYKVRGVRVNRNRGGHYTAEGGSPPVAGSVEIQRLLIPERYYHHALQFTEQVLNSSKSTEGAFADAFRLGVEDLQEGVRIRRNQSLWGDGRGILALANGAVTTAAVTCDSPGGIAGADDGTRFINVGDWVCAVTPAGALRQAVAYEVIAVTGANTFTLGAAATWTDNDYIVKCLQTTGTLTLANCEYQKAPMGMSGIDDNGSLVNLYFSLSRTTFPVMNATVIAAGGAWSADITQRAIDVAQKVGGAITSEIWVESSVKRAVLKGMENDRRYTAADLRSPNAGTDAADRKRYADTGLKFGNIPIMQDPYAPYGQMFGLDKRNLERYPGPMGFVDRDGTTLHLSTTSVDTWDAYFRCFEQFACTKPNQLWKLTGITCDVVIAHML